MKRLATRHLAALATVAFGLVAFTAASVSQALAQPADFGSPPSGEVPILFNDQHVYAKPDTLKQGRVLAALVRGNTVLVPLRSMFEQMGATVAYDPSTKTVNVSKPGAAVQVTVGKPEVIVNGESRPLDVPPEIYKGVLVVPVRVISEGMGAYVQWVPDKRVVVVRYIPAPAPTPAPTLPPPPTPAPTLAPTPVPTIPPTPTPVKSPNFQAFIVGDYIFSPKTYNEFSPGNSGTGGSYGGRAGIEFDFGGLAMMAEGDYRRWQYPHNANAQLTPDCSVPPPAGAAGDPGCVTVIGGNGTTFVPAFTVQDTQIEGKLGIGIPWYKLFLVGGYLTQYGNYGYPRLTGFGGGIERLPNFSQVVDLYGSVMYYPSVSGNFTDPFGNQFNLSYQILRYEAGLTFSIPSTPIFLEAGYMGDHATGKTNAPSDSSHNGIYAGLGIHF